MQTRTSRTARVTIASLCRIGLSIALVLSTVGEASADGGTAQVAEDDVENSHTTTSSSSTSMPNCIDISYCDYDIVTTDGGDFESLEFEIEGDSALGPIGCQLDDALTGAHLTHQQHSTTRINGIATSLVPGARILRCYGEDLFDDDWTNKSYDFTDLSIFDASAYGRDGEPKAPPRLCAANIECQEDHCGHSEFEPEPKCGDAIYDGRVRASDSLAALKTSVGLPSCEPFPTSCDTNGDGEVTANDALVILTVAVGRKNVPLSCPLPCNS